MISHRQLLFVLASAMMVTGAVAPSKAADGGSYWAATWATSIQSAYVAPTSPQDPFVSANTPQTDLSFALPDATASGATDQTFRLIVKPDLWGSTVRICLSNVFGTRPVVFAGASVGLQDYQANVVRGTNTPVTFNGGAHAVQIPPGSEAFSDPVSLEFVEKIGLQALAGRNLSVSVAIQGASGPASHHARAFTTSYISPAGSGDVTAQDDDTAFPFSVESFFFLSEVDVMAPRDTIVIVAFGDSITDGTFSTLNGNDRWSNVMSRKLHDQLGNRVSVVNEGIGGNAVSADLVGQSAGTRLGRDVLGISGVSGVVWLEGINDLGGLGVTPDTVIAGYREVVGRLHAKGIAVVGATVTPSFAPDGQPPSNSPFVLQSAAVAAIFGGAQVDADRRQLNTFVLTSGIYDGTADFSAATTDPATGTLRAPFVPNSEGSAGDYLHPNRYGYQAMGQVAASAVLNLIHH